MFCIQRSRRSLSVLTVVAYLAASLWATGAHDHGAGSPALPDGAKVAAGSAARPTTAAKPRGCRHAGCRHAHRLGRVPSAANTTRDATAGWHDASTAAPAFATACLACEFLAGAISILPSLPTIGGTAARWHDAPPVRPLHRAGVITAFLARGPPA